MIFYLYKQPLAVLASREFVSATHDFLKEKQDSCLAECLYTMWINLKVNMKECISPWLQMKV